MYYVEIKQQNIQVMEREKREGGKDEKKKKKKQCKKRFLLAVQKM